MNHSTPNDQTADLWFSEAKPRITTKAKIAKAHAKQQKLFAKMQKLQKDLILVNGALSSLKELEEFESKLSKPKLLIVEQDPWAIQPWNGQAVRDDNDFQTNLQGNNK